MFLSPRSIFVTMSNALTQNVPVLVGDNYLEWAPKMKAYLMAQGQWASISTTCPEATDSNGNDIKDWNDNNDRATGNIILRLSSAIHQNLGDVDTAKELWDKLAEEYGKPGIPVVYQDFRAAIVTTGCRVRSGRLTRTSRGVDEHLCSESGARLDSQAGDKMY